MRRGYFALCSVLGRMLRSAKYSKACVTCDNGQRQVRKHRRFYAPALVLMGRPLLRLMDTGVLVLSQKEWEQRERRVYWSLRGASIRIDPDGTLVLPCLGGKTLAALLEDPALAAPVRRRAVELAVVALAEFHRLGFTHGDAMAENVLVDLDAGTAEWFDFETVHDSSRAIAWRRADDVRALLATCLVRTESVKIAETLRLILDVYGDTEVTRLLASSFTSIVRRPLTFHLAQAGLSFRAFGEVARVLRETGN